MLHFTEKINQSPGETSRLLRVNHCLMVPVVSCYIHETSSQELDRKDAKQEEAWLHRRAPDCMAITSSHPAPPHHAANSVCPSVPWLAFEGRQRDKKYAKNPLKMLGKKMSTEGCCLLIRDISRD